MSTLVICSLTDNALSKNDLKLIGAAQQLKQAIILVVLSKTTINQSLLNPLKLVSHVIHMIVDDNPFNTINPLLVLQQQYQCDFILATNNNYTKQILATLAANLDVSMLTDVVAIQSNNLFKRPMYSGDYIATIESNDAIKILTIRASAFTNAIEDSTNSVDIQTQTIHEDLKLTIQKSNQPQQNVDLTTADIIITGGRGLGEATNFDLLYQLAEKLNAAVGATRAAVDAGWIDNALQVGQTGKIVAPKIYIAIGVSGAIQHLAGIKDSETIIAINCDPKAPIMSFADYAFEGDLFDIIPKLLRLI